MKKKDWIIIFTLFVVGILISSLVSVAATGNLFDSNEVTYDNTSSGMNSTNVKSAVDELYAAATDYSGLNTRVTSLENRWINSENLLKIKGKTGQTDRGTVIYDDNDVRRSDFLFNTGNGTTNIVSYNATGGWGNFGQLNLWGNPINVTGTLNINGENINEIGGKGMGANTCNVTFDGNWGTSKSCSKTITTVANQNYLVIGKIHMSSSVTSNYGLFIRASNATTAFDTDVYRRIEGAWLYDNNMAIYKATSTSATFDFSVQTGVSGKATLYIAIYRM